MRGKQRAMDDVVRGNYDKNAYVCEGKKMGRKSEREDEGAKPKENWLEKRRKA